MAKRKTKKKKQNKSILECDSTWYNGMTGVLKAGVDVSEFFHDTEEGHYRMEEVQKCMKDPKYFINHYVHIRTADGDIIQVTLRDYQEDFVENILNERFLITMMARQMGKTSTVSMCFLWYLLFKDNFRILVLANVEDKAKEIIEEIKTMIEHLPVWLQEGIKAWNEKTISLANGSKISARATTKKSGRGSVNSIVYVDELAFIDENIVSGFMKSALPSITAGKDTKMIITSTPQGRNYFWKMYTEAKNRISEFKHLFYEWTRHPDRGEDFKNTIISTLGERAWRGEYLCAFEGSSATLIKGGTLEKLVSMDPIEVRDLFKFEEVLNIYTLPQEGHNYFVTHDPSEGLGDDWDYSAIHVFDVTDKHRLKQVATVYNNTIGDEDAPYVLNEICRLYNDAFEISEINVFPEIPRNLIKNCDYDNVYFHNDGRCGLKMEQSKRNKGLKQMQDMFDNNFIEVVDYHTIHELNTFIKIRNKYQADNGEHDDLVTSMNLLCYLYSDKELYKQHIEDKVQYMKKVRQMDVSDEPVIISDTSDPYHGFISESERGMLV